MDLNQSMTGKKDIKRGTAGCGIFWKFKVKNRISIWFR